MATLNGTRRGDRLVERSPTACSANQGRYGFSLGAQHQSLEDFTRAHGWLLPEQLRFRDGEDEDASGVA